MNFIQKIVSYFTKGKRLVLLNDWERGTVIRLLEGSCIADRRKIENDYKDSGKEMPKELPPILDGIQRKYNELIKKLF